MSRTRISGGGDLGEETPWWSLRGHGRGRHAAGARHLHENHRRPATGSWVVELVERGAIRFGLGGGAGAAEREVEVRPGGLLLFAYGERSWYGRREPLPGPHHSRWVSMRGAGLGAHLAALRAAHLERLARPDPHQAGPAAVAGAMDALIASSAWSASSASSPSSPPGGGVAPAAGAAAALRLVLAVAAVAEGRGSAAERPVDAAVRRLVDRPHRAWSLKALAAEHGVTREHLSRVFAERVGEPPHRHLRRRRVRRAVELLRCTELPLAEVARQAGFETTQTLRRHVAQETGRTPTGLRAAAEEPG